MRKVLLAGAAMLAFSFVPASASPLARSLELGAAAANGSAVEQVQYRRWHRHRHRHYHHRHHRRGWGPGLGAGIAAGAIIGGAVAASQARANDAVAYCSQRFRSYDPRSGTYLGYDGYRHPCP
jgi:hypothetical protein